MSKAEPRLTRALTAGILAASGLMYVRVLIEAAVVGPDLAKRLLVPLLILFVAVEGAALWWWFRSDRGEAADPGLEIRNPVTIPMAVQFGLLYGAVVFIAGALLDQFSAQSLSVVGAVSGINDVDAITLVAANLVRDGDITAGSGGDAVLAAVVVNTAVKGFLAVALGGKALALRVGVVLGAAALGGGAAWVML
jgi:uncharacterized membrane protein (DUF4010 family)